MIISELIDELQAIKDTHGDVEVTIWTYTGGNDELHDVKPVYDDKLARIVAQWSAAQGLPKNLLRVRLVRQGWTVEKALTTPPRPVRRSL